MRAVLVFTPPANPTYVPLGITTLCEYIQTHAPDCAIAPVDLNLFLWNRLADADPQTSAFRAFMQGRGGDFYDRLEYDRHCQTWARTAAVFSEYDRHAQQYLETGILCDELHEVLEACASQVLSEETQLVGISVMYPRQVVFSLALGRFLDAKFHGRAGRPVIVLGGATISALRDEEILRACPFVDAVFSGEGELGLEQLCRGVPFGEIAGLAWRQGDALVQNRKPDTISLARIPQPRFAGLDLRAYFSPRPVVPVIYSRGCMWRKCRFCAHNFSYSGYRKRSNAAFVDYLAGLNASHGVRDFYFADQYVDAEDMYRLAQEILDRGLQINFHIMGRPTDSYSPEVLAVLSRAGCRWISWGVETGSQRLLDVCGKGTTVETVRRILVDAHVAGISNLLMMIFGLPTSCDEDLRATLNFLDDMAPYVDDVTCSSFQLWERTAFAANAAAYGLKVTDRDRLVTTPTGPVHSLRLSFLEKGDDATFRPGRGAMEAAAWQRRKKMANWHTHYDGLCCEHYLLYAANAHDARPVR